MLNVGRTSSRNCRGISRRHLLQVGGLGLLGFTLADVLGNPPVANAPGSPRRETSCILIFLEGGPSQLEMFDPKPSAPNDIRGPYGVIPTSVPGLQIGELLPMMADRMNKCALIRSFTVFTG